MKNQNLKDRIISEGFGKIISQDGIDIPEYSEEIVKNKETKKSDEFSKDQLKEMIKEHERLIKVLSSIKDPSKEDEEELKIQKEELNGYKNKLLKE